MAVFLLVFSSLKMCVYSRTFYSVGTGGVYLLVFHSLGMAVYLSCSTAISTACVPDPLSPYLKTGSLKTVTKNVSELSVIPAFTHT